METIIKTVVEDDMVKFKGRDPKDGEDKIKEGMYVKYDVETGEPYKENLLCIRDHNTNKAYYPWQVINDPYVYRKISNLYAYIINREVKSLQDSYVKQVITRLNESNINKELMFYTLIAIKLLKTNKINNKINNNIEYIYSYHKLDGGAYI
jgi:hypothetical protein